MCGLLAAAGTLAGCGSRAPLAAWPPLPAVGALSGPGWREVAASLPARLDPGSANVCGQGTSACMQAVVGEMTRRLDALAASCDHRAPFALMYRQVSIEVAQSVRLRRYREPAYAAHLDAVFATLYFHAYDEWRRGHAADVPRVWQLAFAASMARRVSTLGDMLLGMNAHISRDLPYAIAAVGLRHSDGTDATGDLVAVNADIARAQAPLLAAIARRLDPAVTSQIQAQTWIAPSHVAATIAAWRLEAIANARRLLAARSYAARERVETAIDDTAAVRSLLILRATGYRDPVAATAARDRYCESRRGLAP
jgi:hypothetical protein